MIKLGERIKEFRQRNGRTQDALAEELGVTAQAGFPLGESGYAIPIWK